MKFTFKKYRHTGRYGSFELDQTIIKLKKKEVGYIAEKKHLGYKYQISFAIKKEPTKEKPAPFKWITLKYIYETEKEAREFINANTEKIMKQFDLYQFEN